MGKYLMIHFHQARNIERNKRIVNLGSAAGIAEPFLVHHKKNSMLTSSSSSPFK